MFAFRNQEEVCWHQCLLYTHCLQKKKKKKTSTTNSDHTVPSCPRQTNPGSPFPRTDFWRCAPKRWNVSDAAQKSAEFVWGVHKEGRQRLPHSFCCSTVSCPLSHSCFHAHTHMQTCCVQCVHKLNYTHKKCTHTHPQAHARTHTHTLLPWELQASVTSKHLQCDKNSKYVGCYWAALLSDGCVSPRVCSASVSSASGGSCGLGLQQQTK